MSINKNEDKMTTTKTIIENSNNNYIESSKSIYEIPETFSGQKSLNKDHSHLELINQQQKHNSSENNLSFYNNPQNTPLSNDSYHIPQSINKIDSNINTQIIPFQNQLQIQIESPGKIKLNN
jgi:hypothetical protein